MTAVHFPEVNLELAKDQPEYQALPGFLERKDVVTKGGIVQNVPWSFSFCMELSEEELAEVVRTKKVWYRQMLFGHSFQPVFMSSNKPDVIPAESGPES